MYSLSVNTSQGRVRLAVEVSIQLSIKTPKKSLWLYGDHIKYLFYSFFNVSCYNGRTITGHEIQPSDGGDRQTGGQRNLNNRVPFYPLESEPQKTATLLVKTGTQHFSSWFC